MYRSPMHILAVESLEVRPFLFYIHEPPFSTASTTIRLKWERGADNGHPYKECGTHVDGRGRRRVGRGADDGRDDAHDAVASDSNAVARGAMGALLIRPWSVSYKNKREKEKKKLTGRTSGVYAYSVP